MRLTRRVRSLEHRASCVGTCPECRGTGGAAVCVVSAEDLARPGVGADHCPRCGRASYTTWIQLGETAEDLKRIWAEM